ncbi:MAG: Sua5 YciO YrdC YwlC family protein [Thiovulaceae bacterium]|nr:Sua5 YciO YrdC YwlC family protein [Sulfurimonadaceae bacterium]
MLLLAQTDTTVGFLSKDPTAINRIKQRKLQTPVLKTLPSFKALHSHSRTPKKFRSQIRRLKKSTFILDNGRSFRVVDKNSLHHKVLEKFGALYSSSANATKKSYNDSFALSQADLIIKDERGLFEGQGSHIFKYGREKVRRVR